MNIPHRTLNDGHEIPSIGCGPDPLVGKEGYESLERLGLDRIDVFLIA